MMKEEKNLRKSFNFLNLLQCNGGKNLGSTKNQPKSLMVNPYSTKSFGYWMLVLGRIRRTYGKLVLSRSTTDFRLVLGPAFGSRTILCYMGNHGRTLAPEIMNIFNGRPWSNHAALCCKESLNKIFDKKINPKNFFWWSFLENLAKIWKNFLWKTTQNKPGFFRLG